MTLMAALLTIWDLRREAMKTYTEEIENLGVSFAEQTSRALQAVDLVLDQVKDRVLGSGIETPAQFEQLLSGRKWHQFLTDRVKNLPQADGLALIDAEGKRITASRRGAGSAADFSDRDFIAYFRLHDEPTSFLGMPVKNRTNSGWTIIVARRISGSGGEFLGAIVATIRTDYLEEFYKAITLPELGPVTVLRQDGTIFARYPRLDENSIGQKDAGRITMVSAGRKRRYFSFTGEHRRDHLGRIGASAGGLSAGCRCGDFRGCRSRELAPAIDIHRNRRGLHSPWLHCLVSRAWRSVSPARTESGEPRAGA
jgi:hypothetical protein